MMYFALAFLMFFIAHPAHAQQVVVPIDCPVAANYQGGDEAQYKPGVDVDGNAVAPADLNAVENPLKWPIRVPVRIDILEQFDVTLPEGAEDALSMNEVDLAYLDFYEDGRVFYNEQDLTQQVSPLCNEDQKEAQPGISAVDVGETIEGQYP